MKILVIGSGGRENAIIRAIKKSKKATEIYCAPGNGGTGGIAVNVPIKQDDVKSLLAFAVKNGIDLTVVGPEIPLSLGIADEFAASGLKIFGPDKKAAMLESSKKFAKDFLKKYSIKTASYESFDDFGQAAAYASKKGHPLVIKASGLAAGKGVFVSGSAAESEKILNSIFNEKIFGESGETVVIEEYIDGFELYHMVLTDGISYKPLITSMDYKKIYDGDKGENTGGMGAVTPNPYVSEELADKINKAVIEPALLGLKNEGVNYRGVLYAGIMVKGGEIYVLEFNVRFGDPETQAILIRLESDIIDLFLSAIDGNLKDYELVWAGGESVCLVLASGGYPGKYETGHEISFGGYESEGPAANGDGSYYIFHAGTQKTGEKYFTAGGRVLNVCVKGKMPGIINAAYEIAGKIAFKNKYYRKDIGKINADYRPQT